ncbi:UNVERIFIED_CONTAM: hypothetical protein ABIC26_005068 [Paenibacillus sp. PvR008]
MDYSNHFSLKKVINLSQLRILDCKNTYKRVSWFQMVNSNMFTDDYYNTPIIPQESVRGDFT